MVTANIVLSWQHNSASSPFLLAACGDAEAAANWINCCLHAIVLPAKFLSIILPLAYVVLL